MTNDSQSCLDNHECFRVLLKSMSRPGKIFQLPDTTEANLVTIVFRLLDTVLDQQVSCCLLDDNKELENQLKLRTGTHFTNAENADFLLALSGDSGGKSLTAKRAQLDFPDEGATILFGVNQLSDGTTTTGVRLSGPGIKDNIHPKIGGLAVQELAWLKEVNAEYPLGIDCIFVDLTGQLMCIPRSTRIGAN